jgi:hypothetical protein
VIVTDFEMNGAKRKTLPDSTPTIMTIRRMEKKAFIFPIAAIFCQTLKLSQTEKLTTQRQNKQAEFRENNSKSSFCVFVISELSRTTNCKVLRDFAHYGIHICK